MIYIDTRQNMTLGKSFINKKKNISQSNKTITGPGTVTSMCFCYKHYQRPGIAPSQHENVSSSSPQTASKLSSSESEFSTITGGFEITKPIKTKNKIPHWLVP